MTYEYLIRVPTSAMERGETLIDKTELTTKVSDRINAITQDWQPRGPWIYQMLDDELVAYANFKGPRESASLWCPLCHTVRMARHNAPGANGLWITS